MPRNPKAPDPRVIIPIPRKLLKEVDDYRWSHRIASRAEAIRTLIRKGLDALKAG